MDVANITAAKQLVSDLGDAGVFYKVGLELCMTKDYFTLIEWLATQNKQVFADVKLFDVPQTVASAVKQLNNFPITMISIHGNDAVMQAACAANTRLQLLAVTALTSLDQGDLDDLGFDVDIKALVLSRAKRALGYGCAGVVSSGLEAASIKQQFGDALLVVTPGVRPISNSDDQKRTVNVAQAFANGADYIVVGRPIRDHHGFDTPHDAAAAMQRQICTAVTHT